jgi:hypothetical protein
VAALNGNHGIGSAAREVAEHASALTRLELELAALELKKRVTSLGVGIGLGVAAAAFAFLGLCFGLATIAAAIALALPWWSALLIVTGMLFLVAGTAGLIGIGKLKGGSPPLPEKAIQEAKLTTQAIKR